MIIPRSCSYGQKARARALFFCLFDSSSALIVVTVPAEFSGTVRKSECSSRVLTRLSPHGSRAIVNSNEP